jgi:hypothetical protein
MDFERVGETQYEVVNRTPSEDDKTETSYEIDAPISCSCPDNQYNGEVCKHIRALCFAVASGDVEATERVRTVCVSEAGKMSGDLQDDYCRAAKVATKAEFVAKDLHQLLEDLPEEVVAERVEQ